MKTLNVAIAEFAVPSPRTGSIEIYSGFGPLPKVGVEIHAATQAQRRAERPEYVAEKWISHGFTREDFKIQLSGRMDGYCPGLSPRIEEIKSAYNPVELVRALDHSAEHPYRLQVRTYGYLQFLHSGQTPETVLHIVNSRSRVGFDYPVELDLLNYEAWLERRLLETVNEAKIFEALKKRRKKQAKGFKFPFPEPRQGQIELMATVEKHLNTKTSLLLQAPTGLGKTAGVLFPTLKEAMGRGEKVVYLTPKNSQHAVAEDAVRRLQQAGMKARGQTIHAKAKLCFKEQVLCNPEYCEFAKNHFTKVAEHGLVEKMARKKSLTDRTFIKFGRQYEVCPFELQMETINRADVVICDYNYVFSPRAILNKLTNNGFSGKTAPNLVIDEAHNLPARANEYFSAQLDALEMRELAHGLHHLSAELSSTALRLIDDALILIEQLPLAKSPVQVTLKVERFLEFAARVQEFLSRYLESPAKLQLNDAILRFGQRWADFAKALENLSEDFFCTFNPSPHGGTLKITCCDASSSLQEGYDAFANVVAFSATLKPFEYYSKLLGLSQRPLVTAEFFSPFPRERRKLLIVPQVSTKFSDREANYAKIQGAVERIVELQPGNYFVFFPSFDFLHRVAKLVQAPQFRMLLQRREMKRHEVSNYVEQLREPGRPTLLFAVQGGIFAEGVDYPGEMAIGAIIVGPALPTFDFERELLRGYYAKKHGQDRGFDYAYTFPAMAKVVQSAGRVIRSHTDRGLIVLMDRRFVHQSYVKSMPADWVNDDPQAHVSHQLLTDIRRFWEENGPTFE